MLVDLHVHAPPEGFEALRSAPHARVLDALVVVYGLDELRDATAVLPEPDAARPALLVGVEVDDPRGAFLALPPAAEALFDAQRIVADAGSREVDLPAAFAEEGWAVVALQPFETSCGTPGGEDVATREGVHAVEARIAGVSWRDHDSAVELGAGARLAVVGGTGSSDVEVIGHNAAVIAAGSPTQAEVVAALRAGDAWTAGIAWPSGTEGEGVRRKRRRRRKRRKGKKGGGEPGASSRPGAEREEQSPAG